MSDRSEPNAVEASEMPVFRSIALAAMSGAVGAGLLWVCAVLFARARQDVALDQQVRANDHEIRLQRSRDAVRSAGGNPDSRALDAGGLSVPSELVTLIATRVLG